MNTCLVTCIYDNISNTIFGGTNRSDMYIQSLKIIANTKLDIICFTSSDRLLELQNIFSKYSNIKFLTYELSDHRHHIEIQRLKLVKNYPNSYYEVMHSKFIFLNKVISNYNYSNIFWIDAGLSRAEILAHQYFNIDDIKNERYYNAIKLFTPDLFNKISQKIKNKLLVLFCSAPNNRPIPCKYNAIDYPDAYGGAIAGIFGGNVEIMNEFISNFEKKLDITIAGGDLYEEECIMSGVLVEMEATKIFKYTFGQWYHKDWSSDYRKTGVNCFSDFFDMIMDNYDG